MTLFSSCSNEDGLAQRVHAISRTTLVTLENKNRTTHCEAVKEPSIPHAVPIRAQHGQPAFCVAKPCRLTSWLDGR
jgi:hypothetical protein